MKNTLSEAGRNKLRRLGSSRGAKSYGEWLEGQEDSSLALSRLEADSEGRRAAVGYGTRGESLLRRGLADDGYAAYLRRAVKEARALREAAIESERASKDLAALRGYAAYLEAEREASGERLVSLGEGLVASPLTEEEAAGAIARARVSPSAAAALAEVYRYEGTRKEAEITPPEDSEEETPEVDVTPPESPTDEEAVLGYLKAVHLPYERAYRYCISIGLGEADARRLAALAESRLSEDYRKLHGLFE